MAVSGSHALFFIGLSIILAVTAISTSMHSKHPKNSSLSDQYNVRHQIAINASKALRNQGFNVVATLLQISPEIFLSSPNPQSTIFAIQDSAISNLSVPSWAMKQLLQYHTSPLNLPFQELLRKSQGSCLKTNLALKLIAITKIDAKQRLIEINNVSISHPDVFLEGNVSIHGVTGPFSALDFRGMDQHRDIFESPICGFTQEVITNTSTTHSKNLLEWPRIIQMLSSNGFVSFAIELHSVLGGVVQDSANLSNITIFAPPNLGFLSSPSPLLERVVRLHIVPQRFTFKELALLPEKSTLKTLVPVLGVSITRGKFSSMIAINGVEITAPDIFVSKWFIIHGISRALELEELSFSLRF